MAVRASQLRSLFTYDCDSGQLFRMRARNSHLLPPVEIVGPNVMVSGRCYRTDRVIWHYCYGRWPVGKLVHMNGEEADNRLDNLAEVCLSPIPGKLLGAHFNRRTGRWYAMISRFGRNKSLGTFSTPEEAHRAYLAARDGGVP
jgi:hypothetical protein